MANNEDILRKFTRINNELIETQRKLAQNNAELHRTNEELTKALAMIRTLKGLLPICSLCKKIRDDQGYWENVEDYISNHTDVKFSHGLCPKCIKKLYPNFQLDSE